MKITIEGDLKEIADLAMEVESQLSEKYKGIEDYSCVKIPVEKFAFYPEWLDDDFQNRKDKSDKGTYEFIKNSLNQIGNEKIWLH